MLLDSEHARRAIGEVAVPSGGCAEPSNVKAGGHACPYRFRCAGCDHFRTDASYLPDLTAYLDDLLRTRERVAAAAGLDEWARAEATPSGEKITRIRRLIGRVKAAWMTSPQKNAPQPIRPSPSSGVTAPSISACPAPASHCPPSGPGAPHDHRRNHWPDRGHGRRPPR